VDEECEERLRDAFRLRLFDELGFREDDNVPSESDLRLQFALILIAEGVQPSDKLINELLEIHWDSVRDFQATLDETVAEIRCYIPRIAEQEAKLGDAPVLQGCCVGAFSFPTGQYNAKTILTDDDDYLILINAGLLEMIWQATKIFGHSTRLEGNNFSYLDGVRLGVNQLAPSAALAEVIAAFLGLSRAGMGQVERVEGASAKRSLLLFCSCVKFVVGHEYSHVLAGHFEDPGRASRISEGMSPEEVAADWLAAKLVVAPIRWGQFDDDRLQSRLQVLMAAPLFYFALENLVAVAEERVGHEYAPGLAPPAVRRLYLEPFFHDLAGGDFRSTWPLTRLTVDWVDRMADDVLDQVDALRSGG
jgi:hypothetical protein